MLRMEMPLGQQGQVGYPGADKEHGRGIGAGGRVKGQFRISGHGAGQA